MLRSRHPARLVCDLILFVLVPGGLLLFTAKTWGLFLHFGALTAPPGLDARAAAMALWVASLVVAGGIIQFAKKSSVYLDAHPHGWLSIGVILAAPLLIWGALFLWIVTTPRVNGVAWGMFALINVLLLLICATPYLLPERLFKALTPGFTSIVLISVALAILASDRIMYGSADQPRTAAINSAGGDYWYFAMNAVTRLDGNYRFNSFGFRGEEPFTGDDTYQVLLLGDSMPFGPGVREEQTFASVTESLVNETLGDREFRVLNAAIPSFSVQQMTRYYADRLAEIPHDLLIVGFFIDDINRELRYRKDGRLYTPIWPELLQDWSYQSFWGHRYLAPIMLKSRNFTYDEAWQDALADLEMLNELAMARNIELLVINLPYMARQQAPMSAATDYAYQSYNQRLAEWCEHRGIQYLDLLPALLGVDPLSVRISPSDHHYNVEGHRLIAGQLAEYVITFLAEPNHAQELP